MITATKALGHLDRLLENRPVTADLFLTRRCNSECSYCTYTRHMRRSGEWMSEELFSAVARRLVGLGVRGVILTGGGEPTCSPSFEFATAHMESLGLPYGVNTNGLLFVECHPVFMKISLDAWDEESYRAVRGVGGFETVRDNVRRYCALRDSGAGMSVVLQAVATSAEQVMRFYEANADLPVDTIVFRPIESQGCAWYRGGHDYVAVREAIAAIRDQRVVENPKFGQLFDSFGACHANGLQLAVDERARVVYCCHKPYEVVGSLFDNDILERKAAYRTDMALCDVPCRLTASNGLVREAERVRSMPDGAFI